MIDRLLRTLGPAAALAAGVLLAGCDNMSVQIGDSKGVPLAELDQSGPAPTKLVLAGPDEVIITEGAELAIKVSGDEAVVDALRFSLEDGSLGISRKSKFKSDAGHATVRVTMPALTELVLAGSGTVRGPRMVDKAEVTLAGSGKLEDVTVDARTLELTLAGSGSLDGKGEADTLQLTIAGSGSAELGEVKVDSAEITIAGSGKARFASDGAVAATIIGSGEVTVLGRADCTVTNMGSGTLNCEEAPRPASAAQAPAAPAAPKAPDAASPPERPEAPEAP